MRSVLWRGFFARLTSHRCFKQWSVFLVLLQIAAPLWHVCVLGGHCEKPAHRAKLWKPKCGGGKVCPCIIPPGAIYSPTGEVLDGVPTEFENTCLARVLMGMGRQTAAFFAFDACFFQISAPQTSLAAHRQSFAFTLPPSRGPPASLNFAI